MIKDLNLQAGLRIIITTIKGDVYLSVFFKDVPVDLNHYHLTQKDALTLSTALKEIADETH